MKAQGITASEAYAQVLLERADRWAKGTCADGTEFVTFVSSRMTPDDQPIYYKTRRDGRDCLCPGFRYRGTCGHVLAVRADNERRAQRQTTYHEQLRQREKILRAMGWEKEEYRDDERWSKLAEWVERAERGGAGR